MARAAVLALCLTALAAPASAQVYTGRIDVTVSDATGGVLPGVAVTITGPQNVTAVSDAQGEAHFLNLAPGAYTVSAKLDGFNEYVNRNVPVAAGAGVPLKISLAVGGVSTQVDVTGATPVINPKNTATTTNITYDELQQIPSARDPWVVLQTVPSIVVDRVNVGGAESGQQSNYQAKGASGGDNTWSIDGIPITDMSALGSSPSYYDFDMFQEIAVTTGGADARSVTPGVGLNFVLKSGSNTPHGSSRIYFENESMQSNNLPADLQSTLGGTTGKGNRIDEYQDYGFELGGPLYRDRLWAWGAFGKTDVTLLTLANTPDQTQLENYSFKATGQATPNLRGSFTYFRGEKLKFGRDASLTRPPATTWNQGGPTEVFKGEGNLIVGNNLFLTGRYASVGGGFFLTPQGGLDTKLIFADDEGIARGSWYEYRTDRPQSTYAMDGNFFRGRHEIKFGFGYRTADVDSTFTVPGDGITTTHDGYPNMVAGVTAWNQVTGTQGKYTSAYVGDTISLDRLTVNLAVRWDRQASSVRGYGQAGNPVLPDLLPDLTGQAADDAIVWNSITPRIGVTYALTDDRKTIGRASYATFASQMNAGQAGFFSTVGSFRGVYFYNVTDLDGNGVADPAEIAGRTCTAASPSTDCNWGGFDIDNPANVSSPNHRIGDYSTPLTHELVLGVDRELFTNFGVSANFTWRKFVNFNWRPVQGVRSDDYAQLGAATGSHPTIGAFDVPYSGVADPPTNRTATEYVDREGYSQRYWGLEVSATKRLSNRWMARFGFSTNDHREYFDSAEAIMDPTPQVLAGPVPLPAGAYPNVDGGPVLRQTTGSGKAGIFMVSPRYQFAATGLYNARWGINLAANIVNRQGYSMPYQLTQVATGDPLGNLKTVILVDDVGDHRLPSVTSLDLRLGKEFTYNRLRLNLDFDVFNALNSSTVLGRQYDLSLPTANNVLEIMNPRVLRLGARFSF
ncbi:MAG TPA: TonB-dependent receptor [Vicinamibacterales bacterium]|nr:TonB-dependent receptor [Vicinamibacterales bacterium]